MNLPRMRRCGTRPRVAAVCGAVLLLTACSDPGRGTQQRSREAWFSERAVESGIDFVHINGMSGAYYDAEIVPPGVALLDYDNDGDLDVLLVQGTMLAPGIVSAGGTTGSRLFRNDLALTPSGAPTMRFVDVSAASHIATTGYPMGATSADFNNDGFPDIYVTNLGEDQLFQNNRDGTFRDVTAVSGINEAGWSVSAAFVDFDRDGWLDLFVGNYLRYSLEMDKQCTGWSGEPDYCAPESYQAQPSRLYRNLQNGRFEDVTARAFVGGDYGPALGVSTADFDGDGWLDIYVANDRRENQLWINQKNGTFRNRALLAGVAVNGDGKPEASMGVDAADIDDDGDEDLIIANLTGEGSTLYLNRGDGLFEDAAREAGVRIASVELTGFGAAWIDYDNDGALDILSTNGAVRTLEILARAGDPFPFHQRKQLLRNVGRGRFVDVTAAAGPAFELSEVGRGAAFGDVDNDGDVDVLVGNNNGRTRLFVNEIGRRQHWMGLRLRTARELGNRDALGARIAITTSDGRVLHRRARTDGSFASANDPRILAGLGDSGGPVNALVAWPDGRTEQWEHIAADRWTTLIQGDHP